MTFHMRRSAAAVAVGALMLAMGPIVPAFAATKTTVVGTVLDPDGHPVRGVEVIAINLADSADDGFVEFSATATDGTFSRSRYGQLSAGDWAFLFIDSSDDLVAIEADKTLVTGANTFSSPVQLKKGATISGGVTAPSGAQLKNIDVQAYNTALNVNDPSTLDPSLFISGIADNFSDVDGTYDLRPLVTGTYDVGFSFDEEDDTFHQVGQVTITNPGQALTHRDIFNVRVPADLLINAKASKTKGKATVSALVDASYYGIDSPGGSVSVYDGSKKLTTMTLGTDGAATVALSSLKKGKHSLKYTFSGATDTRPGTSEVVKITVK